MKITTYNHREKVLGKIMELWTKYPKFTLCELVSSVQSLVNGEDIFWTSDEELLVAIEKSLTNNHTKDVR